jgi:hypothetical protein
MTQLAIGTLVRRIDTPGDFGNVTVGMQGEIVEVTFNNGYKILWENGNNLGHWRSEWFEVTEPTLTDALLALYGGTP